MLTPRIERIHHLAIAVAELGRALERWRDVLGASPVSPGGLPQIGLQVSDFAAAIHACRAHGLEPAARAATALADGRRRRCTDASGAMPHFELLEIRSPVASLPVRPLRPLRQGARQGARQTPGRVSARSRGAKVAGASRPTSRSRGQVRRGGRK